jgi:hypothetical protein
MSKMPLLFALLSLLLSAPALVAGPPQGPSSRQVQDAVPALLAEVRRLEKEVARDQSLAAELEVARARLAAAQGRIGAARASWRNIIAAREERLARCEVLVKRGLLCDPPDITFCRGYVAEARCELAEVERDRATLAEELPKVIAYWEARLAAMRTLAKVGAISPDEVVIGAQIGPT